MLLLLPTGLALLRLLELLLRHPFHLTLPERLLFAFYGAGALLFLVASVPFDVYGAPLLAGVLGAGAAVYASFAVREKAKGLRAAAAFARSFEGLALAAGSVGLLLFEIAPVWNHPFPNAWDGSVTALWMNLTLRQGTLPTSLQPFASAPVVYPLATTVWMTLPVLLLGWPLVQTPVLLPPLFLSLTVPAAYCWGSRWGTGLSVTSQSVGLLFSAFFGLVASWPRFYTGGSYDFAFSLPLFLVAVGLLPEFARLHPQVGTKLVPFGLLAGVLTSLSLAAGEALLVLFLVYSLVARREQLRDFASSIASTLILAAFEVAFPLRSLSVWLANGGPSYTPGNAYGGLNARLVLGELDPFVPWKAKLAPFPVLSLELQILLAAGLALAVWAVARKPIAVGATGLRRLGADILIGTTSVFAMTTCLLLSALPGPEAAALRGLSNLEESSTVLFIFFEVACIFPLGIALHRLAQTAKTAARVPGSESRSPSADGPAHGWRPPGTSRQRGQWQVVFAVILVIPLASGSWFTLADGFGAIQQNVEKTSNVTLADVSAMQWMGGHLPGCSGVFVAPGSAGQFLPEYATVRLVLQMNPVPANQSYSIAVGNLTSGVYGPTTRAALLSLRVTEVFVTGQTSVSFPPILPSALGGSSDFTDLAGSGDAIVFGFLPGESLFDCPG